MEVKYNSTKQAKENEIKNEVATKIDSICRNYGLTPSTRAKVTPIFKDEVESE